MMKKVILCTVVSLFVFSGFVAGPWGPDLGIAGKAGAASCKDLPNVEACILIYKDGKVKLKAGNGKTLKKPKKNGEGSPGSGEEPGKKKDHDNLPSALELDVLEDPYTQNDITIYGDETCMRFNGNYYCW
jgi:hypothetical protein